MDPSLFREPQDRAEINELWANLANAIDAKRKFGVTKKGMCLLMAYALESLRQNSRRRKCKQLAES